MFTGRELQLAIEVTGHGLLDALVTPDESMMALKIGQPVRSRGKRQRHVLYFVDGPAGMRLSMMQHIGQMAPAGPGAA
jgi:hypothetical protein